MSSRNVRHGWIAITVSLAVSMTGCARSSETEKTANHDAEGERASLQLIALDGAIVDPLNAAASPVSVFVFTRVDCPVSNRYAPQVRRIFEEFSPKGVAFYLVYPDPEQTADGIRRHMQEYGYAFPALRDPNHQLVARCGARVTPETAVFLGSGELAYRGRIDDWYADFGKPRAAPTRHDLKEALRAVLAGKQAPQPTGKAIGCYISDLSSGSGSHGKN